jgi:iron complex transport system ATP-binding protein
MIEARDLVFAYQRGGPRAVDRVSLRVAPASVVGLLGPNGSGKTTLLRLLAGLLRPQQGTVALDGVAVDRLSRRDIARRLALVPQETHAAFDFSVLDIVLMGRYPHLGAFALEGPHDLALARDALAATGTSAFEHRPFHTLSGGEKQRVVIASALAQSTALLLLDEPTASLDLGYQLEVAELVRRLNRERATTVVISTHDLNLAAATCSDIVLLKNGRVLAQGEPAVALTPANIRDAYGVHADVRRHEQAGHLTVVPLGRAG